ncbi:hypothetical protein IMZ29_00730 [Achromobacter sp. GG226]|uniref:hypothetical protein n=1 Tax=Verticiella alkaliphila TaxID=2779529 RepID=UPI001C0AB8C0|nr:hypothetical protein [Verticiella sp. GG226]MBU4609127.1 hypothetical protein [Verticiella sp. GG226]
MMMPGRLIDSSVPLPDVNADLGVDDGTPWNSTTTYTAGQVVYIPETLARYRAADVAGNLNKPPRTSPTFWVQIGLVNRWTMFDGRLSTQTVANDEIWVEIRPQQAVSGLALMELDGTSVTVQMRDPVADVVVYERTESLDMTIINDWWEWYFKPFERRRDLYFSDFPSYTNGEFRVTLNGTGRIGLGMMSIGTARNLGCAQWGARADFKDYSFVRTDDFGNTTIVRRPSAKNASLRVSVEPWSADFVTRTLADVLSVPCMWIAKNDPGFEALRIFGLGSGELEYNAGIYNLNLSIKGLI